MPQCLKLKQVSAKGKIKSQQTEMNVTDISLMYSHVTCALKSGKYSEEYMSLQIRKKTMKLKQPSVQTDDEEAEEDNYEQEIEEK